MKKKLIPWILGLQFFCLLPCKTAFSVPASPDSFEIAQPGGIIFQAKQVGDEWNNHVETAKGYSIAKGPDDYWYHVSYYKGSAPVLSDVPAHQTPPAGLMPHASPNQAALRSSPHLKGAPQGAAPMGAFSGKILIILAKFTDKSGTYTEADFAATITSINDYYSKASHGKVSFAAATETSGTANNGVIDWVDMGYNHPNTGSSITMADNQKLSRDAITAADPFVDFSTYDTNADGYVDPAELGIVVIAAGYERSYGVTYTPNLWGHKWQIALPPTVDGVILGGYNFGTGVGGYAQFGEIHQSNASDQHQATLGIMVHELGHLFFEFPDLYDTDSSSSGIGAFGLMSHGTWGQTSTDSYSGQTPALPCAWSKLNRGWVAGAAGTGSISITASGSPSATSANTVYKASTGTANEYFLVENRQALGYDKGMEKWLGAGFGGISIWHVDDNLTSNDTDTHRWVDLEEGDGTQMGTSKGEKTDLWYSGNATSFSDTSTPNSKVYAGSASSVSVTSISASSEIMAVFMQGSGINPPSSPSITINGGAVSTTSANAILSLSATDDVGVTGYYAVESSTTPATPGASDSGWTAITSTATYSADVSLTLSTGDGSKTVYVWFRDGSGYISLSASDSINLDTTAPTNPSASINSGTETTPSQNVSIALSATDNIGVTGYFLSESATTPSASGAGWTTIPSATSYSANVSFNLSGNTGFKTVYAWFKDAAGNVSSGASASINVIIPSLPEWGLLLLAILFIPLGISGFRRKERIYMQP